MYIEITSTANKIFKHIKSLGSKSYREKYNEFVIEGARLIKDALQSSAPVNTIVINDSFLGQRDNSEILELISKSDIKIYKLNDRMFKDISHTETPQGILGVVSTKLYSIREIINKTNLSFYIFCDGVQDPGNMGTIIRTADAAGADAVILSKGCVDVYNPKTVRATMGSLFHLPIIKIEDTVEALLYFKQMGLCVISGYLSNSVYHFDVDMKKGVVIVVGNEANGISDEVIKLSDYLVKIPIIGQAESLNAGIASGILMYEVVRQRMM
ncbi:TrmH family RNA methyltransferase [Petroclostridium xylanilyticum]|uniref:TrmH family RNA methyltransferase n=1 Tax=Petroclostridium xylanilyticum TaxID=1792311 RepID=UPI000B992EF9|nr:RNA methyltransferase [Petroclostridium xylanilyticum]